MEDIFLVRFIKYNPEQLTFLNVDPVVTPPLRFLLS